MTREGVLCEPQELLERDRELAEIDALIAAAVAEEGAFVVLEGRSGMGKSALLSEVRARAARAGLATSWARGSELEDDFAFGVVRQLFEPMIRRLSKPERSVVFEGAAALAEPVLGLADQPPAGGQFAAMHGLYWLAANLAARSPVLLAVDDAHWADPASLRWLGYLLNRLEGLPILVAIATRPPRSGPQCEVLAAMMAQPSVHLLQVGPLGERSVATLVRSVLGADPDALFTAAALRASAGNPLALSEMLRELRSGDVTPTAMAAGALDQRAPDAIARRALLDVGRAGAAAERFATALAVIGDGTELRLIAELAGLDLEAASQVADSLLAVDLLALGRPPRYAHPLLRTAVYDHLPPGVRSHMHQRASDILTAERADPEAVAAHLLRSEAAFSGETISRLRVAAPLALRRGAPEAAVSYLRRALNEGADTPTQTAVLAELGRAELAAGDPGAHGHLMRALAGSSMPPERAAILGDLSVAVLVTGDQRGCRDLLEEAFRELRGHDPEASAGLECIVAGMSAMDPRFGSSIDKVYPRLRELAGGDTPTAQLARVTLGLALSWCKGDRDGVLRCVEGGFDWNGLVDGGSSHSFGVTWSMQALLGIDELARAATWCARVMEEGAAEGNPYTVLNGLVFKGYAEFRMGLLADAEAAGTSALEQSRLYGGFWVPVVSGFLAETLLERGRQQAAYDLIEGITLPRGVVGEVVDVIFLEARGRLRCARGWWKRGVEDLRESGRLCEVMGNQNPILPPWRASLAAALAQDDKDEALQLAEYDLANARRSKIPRAIGIALRTLAGVYQSDEAIDLLRVAVATLERSPAALDLARALTDLGSALRRQGHRVEAREPLREALEIAARCGAVPLMDRAQAEALAAGARPRRPRLRGVHALTPSELRVSRLAAEGRSNREIAQALFITAKTVADHLGSSYSKLDISSREQLTAALELSGH